MEELFSGGRSQLGFDLGEDSGPVSYEPDRAEVRRELCELLATAKSSLGGAPWDPRTFNYHKVVFPQMARWLPDDERDQLCFEFAREVQRIEMLLAA